jgi:hypothetical protein
LILKYRFSGAGGIDYCGNIHFYRVNPARGRLKKPQAIALKIFSFKPFIYPLTLLWDLSQQEEQGNNHNQIREERKPGDLSFT